jgi:hypothetical protein
LDLFIAPFSPTNEPPQITGRFTELTATEESDRRLPRDEPGTGPGFVMSSGGTRGTSVTIRLHGTAE